jgi:ferredoxin-NADP reductase
MSIELLPARVLHAWSPTPFTHAIRVERPAGLTFSDSQSTRLVLGEGVALARPMTIASGSARPYLDFAVQRSDSDFKRAFAALRPGDPVQVTAARGHFLLERARPSLMLASGIGITPFRGMLEALADSDARHPGVLVHATRSRFDVPFADEIDALAARTGVRVVRLVGPIDRAQLTSLELALDDARVYIAGPVEDVKAMRELSESLGVTKERLLLEAFRYPGNLSAPPQRQFPDWDKLYAQTPADQMPWYYAELDPDVARALEVHHVARGRALDVGSGSGTQAIALAALGFDATGSDLSAAAVAGAAERAAQRGSGARFVTDDILSSQLDGSYDLILDRGCFHVLAPERRADYVSAIAARLSPGGVLLLKCFADDEPERGGPHHFSPDDIRALFGARFQVVEITRTVYQGTLDPLPRALFSVLKAR